jgi:4a-hydroxytetrahydrobiopterin dehydratase
MATPYCELCQVLGSSFRRGERTKARGGTFVALINFHPASLTCEGKRRPWRANRHPITPKSYELSGKESQKNTARFGVAKRFSGVTRCPVMADLIKQGELKERMKKIPEWELEKKHIERTFEFDDFADAIDFVNAVAEVADEEEHHPDIDIRYNKVRLLLSTHSKGGLTELDFGLAERIDTLAE